MVPAVTEESETAAPLIHIGYPKAGSTWLQAMFAQDGSGYCYPYRSKHYIFYEHLVEPDRLEFDSESAREAIIEDTTLFDGDDVPVISNERLIGHWHTGGYDAFEIADRLAATFPEAKILMTIREQQSMINSVYRQYVRKGGGRSVSDYLQPPYWGKWRGPGFSLKFFDYDRYIRYYHDKFSSDRVTVVPLELLIDAPDEFYERILSFSQAEPDPEFELDPDADNVGIDAFDAMVRRRLNPFKKRDYVNDYSSLYTPVRGGLSRRLLLATNTATPEVLKKASSYRLKQEIHRIVGDHYRPSNRRTNDLIDVDLERFDYDLFSPATPPRDI